MSVITERWVKNIGRSEYRRSNNQVVKRGEMFLATEDEIQSFRDRCQMGIRFVEAEAPVTAYDDPPLQDDPGMGDPSTDEDAGVVEVESGENDENSAGEEEWELSISPARYLKRFPDGPKAALARRLVGEEG